MTVIRVLLIPPSFKNKVKREGRKIEIQIRAENVTNRWSRTVRDKHYNRALAYAACHLERLLTDARHNFVDRPIELLRHQSAGRPNRCMKPVSLFTRLQRPRY